MEPDCEDGGRRRSLSCGDMYGLLEDEKQILLKQASVGEAHMLAPAIAADGRHPVNHHGKLSTAMTRSQLSLDKGVKGARTWVILMGAFFVHLIIDGLCCSYGVLIVELEEHFEASLVLLSLPGALIFALPMLLAPISAGLVDTCGFRAIGFAGGLLSAIGAGAGAFAPSVESLILLYGLLVGLGMSLTLTTSFVVVAVYFERRRAVAAALTLCGLGIGASIWPPLIELLIDAYSWRGALLVTSGLLLQSGAFCLLFRPLNAGADVLRRRLYLRTLENFSRIAGYGEFLMGKEYLASSLVQQIAMLRAHVSIGSPACSAAHGIGNSTVETLAWPSGIEDSSSSSSSTASAAAVAGAASSSSSSSSSLSGSKTARMVAVQETVLLQESCQLLGDAPSLPGLPTDSEELDDLAENLRDIELCDTMPLPESYRIFLPDPTLDVIPEHAELDLTALSLSRMAGSCQSSSSSESLQILQSQAYATYLDLSNPQLDDDEEEGGGLLASGLASYKSLPSARSESGRLASSATMSQSLGSLVLRAGASVRVAVSASGLLGSDKAVGDGVNLGDAEDADGALCRSSSDPELLRRRQAPRPADLFSPPSRPATPPLPPSPSPSPPPAPSPPTVLPLHCGFDTIVPLAAAEEDDVSESSSLSPSSPRRGEISPSCWDPLLLPPSPVHRGTLTRVCASKLPPSPLHTAALTDGTGGSRHAAFEAPSVPADEPRPLGRTGGQGVPFSSIGRLNLALSLSLLLGLSEQELSCASADSGESRPQHHGMWRNRRLFLRSLLCCGEVCCQPAFLCLFLSNFLVFCFSNVTLFYLGLYCRQLGATSLQASLQFAVLGAANFLGQVLVGLLGKLACLDTVIFFAVMQIVLGVSIVLAPLLTDYTTLFFHTITFGLAISANDALSSVMSVHLLGPEKANSGISVNLFGQGLAVVAGPPLLGLMIERASFGSAFFLSGAAIVLAGLIMLPAIILDRQRRKCRPKPASASRSQSAAPADRVATASAAELA